MLYAVIDTNVLVSALLTKNNNSPTVKVIECVFNGEVIPLYSDIIINEYKDVLKRKKFGFSIQIVDYILSAIEKFGIHIEPIPSEVILPDMDDLPFYEIALEKRDESTFLVTGNIKHFIRQSFVVTPAEFLEIIHQRQS